MEQYTFNPVRYGTHRLVAEEIGRGKLVLDVGFNKGYLKQLAARNIFFGIDYNGKDLKIAKKSGYRKVYKIDLNNYRAFKSEEKFDVIVFADILEHLLFPEKVLKFFVENYLKNEGSVIISLPNVANFSVRFNLLAGNFNYSDCGILDKTHLHLYTLKTGRELINRCNLTIIKEKFSSNLFGKLIKIFPSLGTILGFNLIFICQKKS